ncbi:purine nucleoside permease [Aestuariicella hydrocarbonica]|uniref:Purine nucleoside permease n=1 Tax=Pseudomaricurvus hydrocarbonicus TaxID=1470433 RepID=A0A9E5JWL4_9GAMM|nr:purine nucleoside permease [Aestuariicella hydrocarbonica]NHO66235.1 purine nucleoside permease [Aestuariicella hydrocarbonica]
MNRLFIVSLIVFLAACRESSAPHVAGQEELLTTAAPIAVKVVVVNMFELGEDEGDAAGEFQLWKERQQLSQRFAFPQSHHDLFLNPDTGVLGMVTGMGTNRSSSAIMALGLDPRFDLSKAYWLVVGIAGFDPEDASIGSAAWAEWVVDGDLGHEIDARELPQDWTTGIFPLFSQGPYPEKRPPNQGEVFHLNGKLTDWAYEFTKDTELPDDPAIAESRALFTQYPKAQLPPQILKGDNLAGMTFWHGQHLNRWANQWVEYWTEGQGQFVSSAMEDTGTAQSLFYLDRAGKADYQRLMVLRTASNFTVPAPGLSAAESLLHEGESYAGLALALESAYRVGGKVVDELVNNWSDYQHRLPYEE